MMQVVEASELALTQVSLRLQSITEIGDAMLTHGHRVQVAQARQQGRWREFIPALDATSTDINSTLTETMAQMGQYLARASTSTSSTENAEELVEQAKKFAEEQSEQLKDSLNVMPEQVRRADLRTVDDRMPILATGDDGEEESPSSGPSSRAERRQGRERGAEVRQRRTTACVDVSRDSPAPRDTPGRSRTVHDPPGGPGQGKPSQRGVSDRDECSSCQRAGRGREEVRGRGDPPRLAGRARDGHPDVPEGHLDLDQAGPLSTQTTSSTGTTWSSAGLYQERVKAIQQAHGLVPQRYAERATNHLHAHRP